MSVTSSHKVQVFELVNGKLCYGESFLLFVVIMISFFSLQLNELFLHILDNFSPMCNQLTISIQMLFVYNFLGRFWNLDMLLPMSYHLSNPKLTQQWIWGKMEVISRFITCFKIEDERNHSVEFCWCIVTYRLYLNLEIQNEEDDQHFQSMDWKQDGSLLLTSCKVCYKLFLAD